MIEIKVNAAELQTFFTDIQSRLQDMTPLMRAISRELLDETEANFAAEGRPQWAGLQPSTIKRREAAGKWPGKILTVSGQLAASVRPFHGADYAGVGSNKAYAAIHQLGGVIHMAAQSRELYFRQHRDGSVGNRFIKRKDSNFAQWATRGAHDITIKPRPYLPIDADGNLQPEAEIAIYGVVQNYLRKIGFE